MVTHHGKDRDVSEILPELSVDIAKVFGVVEDVRGPHPVTDDITCVVDIFKVVLFCDLLQGVF